MSTAAQTGLELEDLLRRADFPDVDHAAWKQRVEEELGEALFADTLVERTVEGIEIEPLYSADSVPVVNGDAYLGPRVPPPLIAQEYPIANPDEAAAAIAAGCSYGVNIPWLPVRYVGDSGTREGSAGTIAITDAEELRALLQGIPETALTVVEVVGDLEPLAGVAEASHWGFLCDPIGEAFRGGEVGESLERALAARSEFAVRHRGSRFYGPRTMLVASSPFHDAGASAVDELALTLAAGVESLRRAVAAGLGVRAAVSRTLFAFSIADDLFLEIAKLRAGRLLWSKVSSAAGVRSGAWTWICARTSMRGFSHDDPRTNLLRNAVRCFAAFAGGADGAALPPYDPRPDAPAEPGRRLAVMTQQVLLQEAGLDRVFDPAGGSWYIEALTDRLARAAWKLFQELEGAGGIVRCLRDGRVDEIVRRSAERREAAAEEG